MTTIVEIENRVSTLLLDMTHLNFTVDVIDEGVRQALLEYSKASGRNETITGLDGAESTTLADLDTGMIVLGAAGFAASAKGVDRKESFNLNDQISPQVKQLGERFLDRFQTLILTVRCDRLRSPDVQAWGAGWPLAI
jgi:hypothetical protein